MGAWLTVLSFAQYQIWRANDFSQHLLPPHTPITYFLFYIFTRFFAPYLISLSLGLLFFLLAHLYNSKKKEILLSREELWMIAATIFLVGWPGVVYYVPSFFLVFLIFSFISSIIYGKSYRTSPYYLWIPVAVLVILVSELYLSHTALWLLLKV